MLGGRWERTEAFFVAQMSTAEGGDSGEEWGGEGSGEEEGGALRAFGLARGLAGSVRECSRTGGRGSAESSCCLACIAATTPTAFRGMLAAEVRCAGGD